MQNQDKCLLMARRFAAVRNLPGHGGHGRTCCWPDPVAIDPPTEFARCGRVPLPEAARLWSDGLPRRRRELLLPLGVIQNSPDEAWPCTVPCRNPALELPLPF